MKRIAIFCLLFAGIAHAGSFTALVVGVADGDTLTVLGPVGAKLRFHDI